MPTNWMLTLRRLLAIIVLCLAGQDALAGSPMYHQSIVMGKEGTPFVQLTNDSELPITAFIMVEFPSLGMEGRTYFDVYINQTEDAIPPGASVTLGLSSFKGSESKVRAEVRAVIFKDGSSAGDPVWVNAVLARRFRMYDRLLSLHDLVSGLVGIGITREGILERLRAAQTDVDKQLPEDDLRTMDDLAFHGAISTFDANRETKPDFVLNPDNSRF